MFVIREFCFLVICLSIQFFDKIEVGEPIWILFVFETNSTCVCGVIKMHVCQCHLLTTKTEITCSLISYLTIVVIQRYQHMDGLTVGFEPPTTGVGRVVALVGWLVGTGG